MCLISGIYFLGIFSWEYFFRAIIWWLLITDQCWHQWFLMIRNLTWFNFYEFVFESFTPSLDTFAGYAYSFGLCSTADGKTHLMKSVFTKTSLLFISLIIFYLMWTMSIKELSKYSYPVWNFHLSSQIFSMCRLG